MFICSLLYEDRSMIKVLSLVSYPFLPAKVGGQKGIALFNKYLSRHLPLECVTVQKNDPAAAEGYVVHNILSNSPIRYINPFYFFTLRSLIRKQQITHLILEHPFYGWLALLLKWFTGVKLVVHSHNIEGLRWRSLGKWWWKILWQYEKWVHRQAHLNFFISDADRRYAMEHFGLKASVCMTATYGIEWDAEPTAAEKQQARQWLLQQYAIPADHALLLFNGSFDYAPNLQGLEQLVHTIVPLLQQRAFPFTLVVCGKHIPASLVQNAPANTQFAGFVDDISIYFKGADVFVNPILGGGGIKTKLVESLGHGLNAVSTENGAIGVDPALCGGKLLITEDGNWGAFADAIVQIAALRTPVPPAYFDHFYWGNITKKAAAAIERIS